MPCHLGTHIDAPKHFDDSGRPIASYSVNDLIFNKPSVLDIVKESGEMILPKDLHQFEESISVSDMLLLRTGFQKYREADPRKYATENPGVSTEAAKYLAGFGGLRALGFDFISLSSVLHREEGRTAHRTLLAGRNFFIVEDMDLVNYHPDARRIIVAPLFIEGVDSTPCTVLAEY
jgi:kynurenine formamidase